MANVRRHARSRRSGGSSCVCPSFSTVIPGQALGIRRQPGGRHAGLQRPAAGRRAVKHLPLFFDLRGRRVVVVGEGPAADRRAALARSAGAEVRQLRGRPRRRSARRRRRLRRHRRSRSRHGGPARRQVAGRAGERRRPAGALRFHPAGDRRSRRRRGGDLDRRRLADPGGHPAWPHRGGVARAHRQPGAARDDLPRPGQRPDRRSRPPPRLLASAGRGTGGAPGPGRRRCRRPPHRAGRARRRPPPAGAGRHRPYRRRRPGRSRSSDPEGRAAPAARPTPSCTTSSCRRRSWRARVATPSSSRSASAKASRAGRRTRSTPSWSAACAPARRSCG